MSKEEKKKRKKRKELLLEEEEEEIVAVPAHWTTKETRGFLTLSLALVFFLSLLSFAIHPDSKNLLGLLGYTFGWAAHALFGLCSYLGVVFLAWIGWRLLFSKPIRFLKLKILYVMIAAFSCCMLLSVIESDFPHFSNWVGSTFYPGLWTKKLHYHLGGAPFYYLYKDLPAVNLSHLLNTLGVSLIFTSTLISSLLFLFKIRPIAIVQAFIGQLKKPTPLATSILSEEPVSDFLRFVKLRIPTATHSAEESKQRCSAEMLEIHPQTQLTTRPSLSAKSLFNKNEEETNESFKDSFQAPLRSLPKKTAPSPFLPAEEKEKKTARETALESQKIYNGDFTQFQLPGTSLIQTPKKIDQVSLKKDLKRQAEVLEETLFSFGIEAKVGQINCGPTITSFEVHPAIGVKVQKIKALDNDIALNMEAKSIRIIAPIPGKAAVGIEVPNSEPQEVGFKDLLTTYQQGSKKFHIPILLGKAVNGDYVMSDLAKMPHCIIAGATGSGKSVCINTIVMSILLNARPDQIKLIMVDPKKVELTPYTKLPHMLAPVITEPQGAAAALNWLVKEMENRYELLKLVGVRNIDSFNQRAPNQEAEAAMGKEIPLQLPYIVGIIDELADLMMVASSDIETPIARIAQMARAVGIHLILATQRPSREVITGIIKANFPTRISFKVASRINSQIVLDETGAESLLGNGDMLFLPPGSSHLIRAQGAFIRDEDITKVINHICQQAPPNYVIQSFDRMTDLESLENSNAGMELDSLYEQAQEVILSTGNASTTFLQRKLKIGYARAASLMDQLEKNGIIGPSEGAKPRKIFARKAEEEEETILESS